MHQNTSLILYDLKNVGLLKTGNGKSRLYLVVTKRFCREFHTYHVDSRQK